MCVRVHAPCKYSSLVFLCSEGHRQNHNDEDDDSNTQKLRERETEQRCHGDDLLSATASHSNSVIGFEMKEGGNWRKDRWWKEGKLAKPIIPNQAP